MIPSLGSLTFDGEDVFRSGQIPGDFYCRESSSVTRGVQLSLGAASEGFGIEGFGSGCYSFMEADRVKKASLDIEGFGSDCYSFMEADHVKKSSFASGGGVEGKFGMPMDSSEVLKGGFQGEHYGQDLLERSSQSRYYPLFTKEKGNETDNSQFSECNTPPPVPTDIYYVFEPTMFKFKLPAKGAPHNIGNHFLAFLDKEKSTVLKVRQEKGWVGANVFLDGEMCRLKARFYRELEGVYSLELQRRTGCVLTFNKVYKRLVSFFQDCQYDILPGKEPNLGVDTEPWGSGGRWGERSVETRLTSGGGTVPFIPPPLGFGGGDPTMEDACVVDISVLVKQMLLTELPSMQAEGFKALAVVATFKPCLFKDVTFVSNTKELLTGKFPDDEQASYAFAHMLSLVTKGVEATQALSENGILPLMADKIYQKSIPSIVRKEFAQALVEAAEHLSSSHAKDTDMRINELKDSLRAPVTDKIVQELVHDAKEKMRSRVRIGSTLVEVSQRKSGGLLS